MSFPESHTANILQGRVDPGLLSVGSMFPGILARFGIWKDSRIPPEEGQIGFSEVPPDLKGYGSEM